MNKDLELKDQKWNTMWELWTEGETISPYSEIMEYYSEIQNGGHAQYFSNLGDLEKLDDNIKVLLTSLPNKFVVRLEKAYELYFKYEYGEDTEKMMEKCDKLFYHKEKIINKMLEEYASTMTL